MHYHCRIQSVLTIWNTSHSLMCRTNVQSILMDGAMESNDHFSSGVDLGDKSGIIFVRILHSVF